MSRPVKIESLIVFSHLRWDFVFQRPQHLLTRLARRYQIYFFEEPVVAQGKESLEISEPTHNVRVYRPHSTATSQGFHDEQIPTLQRMVLDVVRNERIENYGVWFYSPMALPLMQELSPTVVVYDCMDELSAFRNAPRQLLQREGALLKQADVVFTGGPSLHRAKRSRHHNVHCFPSSVDADHFRAGRLGADDHPLQQALPRPRLGYYGVIDERIDLKLVAQLADATRHWEVCMVGPLAKITADQLPQRPNLHYFGQQSYQDLPRFVAGWDVCLQPFALNEATRFISPTKTLEYMAAALPIVTTPITDVVEPYGHIVHVANDAASFIEQCERALRMSESEFASRAQLMRATVANTSWDRTADQMCELLVEAAGKRKASVPQVPTHSNVGLVGKGGGWSDYATIIIGGGPTGLSAAYHLGEDCLLLEQNATIGGWCRSLVDNGFTFDYAGHIMFSNDPYVHEMYDALLGDNVHWQDREAWIYSKSVYTRYPFQGALYGLPPDVLKECIVGAIEARFGRLNGEKGKPGRQDGGSPSSCKPESITDCCGDGIAESTAPLGRGVTNVAQLSSEPANFEEFIYKVWGTGVARHFAIPYNRKLWAVPLSEMETSWLGGRVPLPDLEEMIEGALRPVAKQAGPNARFGYPLRGGFQALMNGFLPLLKAEVQTHAPVCRVSPRTRTVTLTDGRHYRYRKLVSTAPLPQLIQMIGSDVPQNIRTAVQQLRHVSVRCVNLGVARERVTDKHWIYYPEASVFHRIFVQGNASPHCNPPGGFGLTCEITYSPDKPLPCEGEALIDRCIADCVKVGLLRDTDAILARNQVDMPYAYVVYDHVRAQSIKLIREWLLERDILLAGRYSEWEYYNSDHAFIAGRKIAEEVRRSMADTEPTRRGTKNSARTVDHVVEQASN